jgi:hypothetical protein
VATHPTTDVAITIAAPMPMNYREQSNVGINAMTTCHIHCAVVRDVCICGDDDTTKRWFIIVIYRENYFFACCERARIAAPTVDLPSLI